MPSRKPGRSRHASSSSGGIHRRGAAADEPQHVPIAVWTSVDPDVMSAAAERLVRRRRQGNISWTRATSDSRKVPGRTGCYSSSRHFAPLGRPARCPHVRRTNLSLLGQRLRTGWSLRSPLAPSPARQASSLAYRLPTCRRLHSPSVVDLRSQADGVHVVCGGSFPPWGPRSTRFRRFRLPLQLPSRSVATNPPACRLPASTPK
jgi:hypothetical protein